MKYLFAAILLILSFNSCIDRIDLNPPLNDDWLVVEGFFTDELGPHEIRLSRVAPFAGTFQGGTIFPVFDAEVFLTDQDGEVIPMELTQVVVKEIARGGLGFPPKTIFRTPNSGFRTPADFRAIPGNEYTLNINLLNGTQYRSTPQQLFVGPEIDSVSTQFKILPSADPVTFESGVEIFSSWKDPVEESNFYSWRINGTYFIETTPGPLSNDCLFDPEDGCCEKCFIEEMNIKGNLLSYSDAITNGSDITQSVGFILDDGIRFGNTSIGGDEQYWVEIEQHTFSPQAFSFYNILRSQLEIDGDIFDPPPAEVTGNIFRVDDPDEPVLGFFSVNSIKRASTFIKRSSLDVIKRWPGTCGDCRIRAGATLETPEPYR